MLLLVLIASAPSAVLVLVRYFQKPYLLAKDPNLSVPGDLTLSGVSSSSSDSSAASASSSSSSDDAASSGAPSSSSPGGSEGSPDAAAAASEEAGGHARGRMSDDSAYDPLGDSQRACDNNSNQINKMYCFC